MEILALSLCPVTFTTEAKAEIHKIYHSKNIPKEYGLRVATEGGGCAAVKHIIGFDKIKDTDKIYDLDGINVFVEKKHLMFLFGCKVNYISNGHEQGFEFVK